MKLPGRRTAKEYKTEHKRFRKPHASYVRMATLVAVVALTGWLGMELLFPSQAAAPSTQAGLAGAIENVQAAPIYRYNTLDSQGVAMYGAKVIPAPGGGYLAVYTDGRNTRVASSSDLRNWTFRTVLTTSSTMPSILSTSAGGFVFADEYNPGSGATVRLFHFPNLAALYSARFDKIYSAARTLSSCNEGTPNIISVSLNPDIAHSVIKLGFHYNAKCGTSIDRTAGATLTNFSSWQSAPSLGMDAAVTIASAYAGRTVSGGITGLDMTSYGGTTYGLIGGQTTQGDNNSWRIYLFNFATNQAQILNIRTHKGTQPMALPRATVARGPDGSMGVIVTALLGNTAGESGELIYYVRTSDPPAPAAPAKPATPPPAAAKPSTPTKTPSATPTPPAATPPADSSTQSGNSDGSTTKNISLDEIPVGEGSEDGASEEQSDEAAAASAKDKKFRNISLIVSAVIIAAGIGLIMFLRRRTLATEVEYDGYNYNANDEFGFMNDNGPVAPSISTAPTNDAYAGYDPTVTPYDTPYDAYSPSTVAPADTYSPPLPEANSAYSAPVPPPNDMYAQPSVDPNSGYGPSPTDPNSGYGPSPTDVSGSYDSAPQALIDPNAGYGQAPNSPTVAYGAPPAEPPPAPIDLAAPESLNQQPRKQVDDYWQ